MTRLLLHAARHPWRALAVAAFGLLVVVLAVVGAGVVPITASSRHWPVTEWFLHFAMRRSVITHALKVGTPPPDLDSEAMVVRGAGHYETGCRVCHGTPGGPLPAVPAAATPHPPALPPRLPEWSPEQLFYIVKHGVKFTGMPAWPAQTRDDEVWAMVAFLRRMPAMTAGEYAAVVWSGLPPQSAAGHAPGPMPAPPLVAGVCARCHGVDGAGRGIGAFPTLAGQRLEYMRRAMRAYADGRRFSGMMQPLAQGLSTPDLEDALRHYASMSIGRGITGGDGRETADVARGETIARDGIPSQELPPCLTCHEASPVNDAFPRLYGQHASYLRQQLRLLQGRRRGGSAFVTIMHSFVDRLTDEQIDQVSAYFASAGVRP